MKGVGAPRLKVRHLVVSLYGKRIVPDL